jgi:hypothetical protein
MASPFPGMDPFLEVERLWPWFQHQLVIALQQMVSPGIEYRYRVEIRERRFNSDQRDHCEEYLEIRDRSDGRLVTWLDIVSPAVKLSEAGRTAYRNAHRAARESQANVVEIDLVLQGEPILDYPREGLPGWDYAVTVTRGTMPQRQEIYTSLLEKRLPRFRLPLAPDDRDTVMDLQESFNRAYDDGGFANQIDYGEELAVPLNLAVRERVVQILRKRKGKPGCRVFEKTH